MEKILFSKIAELEAKKAAAPFWKKWWVQKLINFLENLLIEVLAARHDEEKSKSKVKNEA